MAVTDEASRRGCRELTPKAELALVAVAAAAAWLLHLLHVGSAGKY